jgi:hypothetical protein
MSKQKDATSTDGITFSKLIATLERKNAKLIEQAAKLNARIEYVDLVIKEFRSLQKNLDSGLMDDMECCEALIEVLSDMPEQ